LANIHDNTHSFEGSVTHVFTCSVITDVCKCMCVRTPHGSYGYAIQQSLGFNTSSYESDVNEAYSSLFERVTRVVMFQLN